MLSDTRNTFLSNSMFLFFCYAFWSCLYLFLPFLLYQFCLLIPYSVTFVLSFGELLYFSISMSLNCHLLPLFLHVLASVIYLIAKGTQNVILSLLPSLHVQHAFPLFKNWNLHYYKIFTELYIHHLLIPDIFIRSKTYFVPISNHSLPSPWQLLIMFLNEPFFSNLSVCISSTTIILILGSYFWYYLCSFPSHVNKILNFIVFPASSVYTRCS